MRLFSGIYTKVMSWSRHQYATYWLAVVSFTESSFFVIPPDVMLAPMTLAKPEKAWFYASLTTLASVLGGLLGYVIGVFAIEMVEPWLHDLDYFDSYQLAQAWFSKWGFWAIFLAGFTPIPYKIFTIAAGAAAMALVPFIFGSLIGRGLRMEEYERSPMSVLTGKSIGTCVPQGAGCPRQDVTNALASRETTKNVELRTPTVHVTSKSTGRMMSRPSASKSP